MSQKEHPEKLMNVISLTFLNLSFIVNENKWEWMVGNCPQLFFLKTTKLTLLHRLFECLPAYDIVVWSNMETGAALIAISDILVSNPMPILVLAHMMISHAARSSNGLSF